MIIDRDKITADHVRTANRKFYDSIANNYENIDGRRTPGLEEWLRGKLTDIREMVNGGTLLDIGAGSGFVTRCAEGLFSWRVGTDLSSEILEKNRESFDKIVVADASNLPFEDESFDVVTCFATLHHLYDFDGMVSAVARILKPGGIFYSDHDMDAKFYQRFKLPLKLYRKIHNAALKYGRENNDITEELYQLSEWHESGIASDCIIELFTKSGCTVETAYHWYGLSLITDKLFGNKTGRRGWAPLCSMIAIKK